MKFKLILEPTSNKRLLPINYQYEFSSWIYKTISFGNPIFSEWLHSHGYMDGNKQFKLFTFSGLQIKKFNFKDDRLEILDHQSSICISFYTEESAEPFIIGLFNNQAFTIGDKISKVDFLVKSVEKLPEPTWTETMEFITQSPMVISYKLSENATSATYLSPDDSRFAELLINNLKNKLLALDKNIDRTNLSIQNSLINPEFNLLNLPKSKNIKIKAGSPQETYIKGYNFKFTIKAPIELLRIGYYAGFGEKNSLGFGSVEVLSPTTNIHK